MIVNLIPMAGEGERFKKGGHVIPKPLIDVAGTPMVARALRSLPKADLNLLIMRKDQINLIEFKKMIKNYADNVEIIQLDKKTDGQASTCLIAEDYIKKDSILNIGSCDVGFQYDFKKYINHIERYDAVIWTYKGKPHVLENPNMYGWVKIKKKSNEVKFVSCKNPISNSPIKDYVVSGTFSFKKAEIFFKGIRKMIKLNDKVNNEFYVDNIFNHLKNYKLGIFNVDKHFSWGTPDELNLYLANEEE